MHTKSLENKNYSIRVTDSKIVDFIDRLRKESGKSNAAVIVDLLHEAYRSEKNKKIYRFKSLDPGAVGVIAKIKKAQEEHYREIRKLLKIIKEIMALGYDLGRSMLLDYEVKLELALKETEEDYLRLLEISNLELIRSDFDPWILAVYWHETKDSLTRLHHFLDCNLSDQIKKEVTNYIFYQRYGWYLEDRK